jgi:peptidyl-prolyl cis-trans isomerase SurA
MNFRVGALTLICFFSVLSAAAYAQNAQSADFIVAVVNAVPITNSELTAAVKGMTKNLQKQRQVVPADAELRRKVLDQMVSDRAQLQLAQETGIRVDDAAIEQAELDVAAQRQVDLTTLHSQLAKDGLSVALFREQLRDRMTLSRLREREVQSRIRVTDVDVDRAIQEQLEGNKDPFLQELNLAQLLVAAPEKATPDQLASLYKYAEKILARIRGGEDFDRWVQSVSAADRANGGRLGLRRADQYPQSFVLATEKLPVGGVSEIVRSAAGFHILKVMEKRAPSVLVRTVQQTRARHILLRQSPEMTQAVAQELMVDLKKQIQTGRATFQDLARAYSQDGSAAQGGDLGWANPGMFVPEFEEALNRLAEGEVSNPVVTRFGVHLIEMVERRRVDLSPREVRELVRNQLRESRYQETFVTWAKEVLDRAFVEIREPVQ